VFASLEHTFYGGSVLTFNDLRGQARPPDGPALFDVPPVERTFDSPEFRGVTFYEVQAKSLLNRVPGSGLPFNWTVNVYRGCSHGCSYCVQGETPILMADGRTKPMADLRIGDAIYGTVFDGKYRRYAVTEVLDHWSTVKPAYRVTLEDGTTLVTSGDHRFLTDRGWKHVAPSERGQRPYLTTNNELLGTGQFASPPKDDADYRQGYLCGMVRGDGTIGSYPHRRPNGSLGVVHGFRLALIDTGALARTREYLADLGIETREFVYQEATATRKRVYGIRTGKRSHVESIRELIGWPEDVSPGWQKGFLAGIFDAEGSRDDGGAFRIANCDTATIQQIRSCLDRFGFASVVETQERAKPLHYVRLLGGQREQLRFFHTFDPAITRKRRMEGRAIKNDAALRVVSVEPLGLELPLFDITTGTGDFIADGVVSHNCFARPTHTYLNFGSGADFERRIVVKVNAAEVLRRELRRPTWTGEHVAMGTNTDPYQRCEGRYRLTRSVLEVFKELRNPCSVLTKSPLLTRDLDVMTELRDTAGFSAALSIGTLDEEVWRSSEPGTPHPRARVAAVRTLREAGIECGVLVAPILPGISDHPEQLKAVVGAVAEAGATHISGLTLHLRPGVKDVFMPWLEQHHPELVTRYQRMYRGSNAPKHVRAEISGRVADARRELPGPAPTTWRVQDRPRTAPSSPGPPPEQLDLGLG
jgi:DNA repair photolyase